MNVGKYNNIWRSFILFCKKKKKKEEKNLSFISKDDYVGVGVRLKAGSHGTRVFSRHVSEISRQSCGATEFLVNRILKRLKRKRFVVESAEIL